MDQARALKRAGHHVTVLYCDTYSVKCVGEWINYEETAVCIQEDIPIYRTKVLCPLKHGMEGHREHFSKGILRIFEQYKAEIGRPDMIHAHCCVWAGYAAMRLSQKTGIPYVVTEHATLFQLHKKEISKRNNAVIKKVFQNAQKVICVSRAFARLLEDYTTNIEVIGNVVDCQQFKAAEVIQKDNTNIQHRFLTICYMEEEAQLYKKGIDLLIKAWAEIAPKYPHAKLIIGGGGKARKKVVEWIEDYCVAQSVELLGALERQQVIRQMQQCDCFVLPSRYETFGVVYIEAMACGKPVIAAANGGPDEFVKDFNGILIQPEQEEELVQAIENIIARVNREDSPYRPETIASFVEERFSYRAIARQLEIVYENIIN